MASASCVPGAPGAGGASLKALSAWFLSAILCKPSKTPASNSGAASACIHNVYLCLYTCAMHVLLTNQIQRVATCIWRTCIKRISCLSFVHLTNLASDLFLTLLLFTLSFLFDDNIVFFHTVVKILPACEYSWDCTSVCMVEKVITSKLYQEEWQVLHVLMCVARFASHTRLTPAILALGLGMRAFRA